MASTFAFPIGCLTPNPCFDDKTKTLCKDHTGTCRADCPLWAQYEIQHAKDIEAQNKQRFLDTIGDDSSAYVKRQNCRRTKKR